MFDLSAFEINQELLLLNEDINLLKARDLFVYFAIKKLQTQQIIYPETVENYKNTIEIKIKKACLDKKFICFVDVFGALMKNPPEEYFKIENSHANFKTIIKWAQDSGIYIPKYFYCKFFPFVPTEQIVENKIYQDNDQDNVDESTCDSSCEDNLFGKEKQELGRLRRERADSICKCTTQGIPHDFIGCPVA